MAPKSLSLGESTMRSLCFGFVCYKPKTKLQEIHTPTLILRSLSRLDCLELLRFEKLWAFLPVKQMFIGLSTVKVIGKLSGLVVDVFDKHIVVASSAAWVEKYKTNIEETLKRLVGTKLLTWRPSVELLKEEGFECVIESEERPEEVHVLENGIAYQVSLGGQKTGFYVDQRDNRLALRSFCKDKTILDLCCYTGAFALNAAITGASRVIGVDSSKSAIDLADANISLNNIDPQVITFEKADIVQYMKAALSKGETWDVVVLDPPKLAPSRKFLEKAAIKYRNLNAMAMQLTKPGGLLMTCSCSGAVAQSQNFLSIIQEAARAAGRKAALLRVSGAGPDHPIDLAYPEGSYLTNCLLRVI
ncbi:uncharacterized protein LOC9642425 isoform X3 [Selaginella moellendorffii]|uniref:uncharacterized protein LOC9642425 isoform X3 n=1 Tax=Selaginella moellendorffii TaxID=88036 RepID=UPI000D1D09D3|nr:uncharacterized protein LOC9642425 isoform X3 [Selaginella moellendorffii]|eukprot:XP_024534254.1 uncharacterized protein LOC9642425 isoform X3 [Selaginella moellendorffii]